MILEFHQFCHRILDFSPRWSHAVAIVRCMTASAVCALAIVCTTCHHRAPFDATRCHRLRTQFAGAIPIWFHIQFVVEYRIHRRTKFNRIQWLAFFLRRLRTSSACCLRKIDAERKKKNDIELEKSIWFSRNCVDEKARKFFHWEFTIHQEISQSFSTYQKC